MALAETRFPRRLQLAAAGFLIALGVLHLAYHLTYTLDDAYISFR